MELLFLARLLFVLLLLPFILLILQINDPIIHTKNLLRLLAIIILIALHLLIVLLLIVLLILHQNATHPLPQLLCFQLIALLLMVPFQFTFADFFLVDSN